MLSESQRAVLTDVVIHGPVSDYMLTEWIDDATNPAITRQEATPPMILEMAAQLADARLKLRIAEADLESRDELLHKVILERDAARLECERLREAWMVVADIAYSEDQWPSVAAFFNGTAPCPAFIAERVAKKEKP